MAAGQDEKEYLRQRAREDLVRETIAPLPDEAERLETFARTEGSRSSGCKFPVLSDQLVQLYVRQTHARRSAARVRAHFKEHPAVGRALAHLCEGRRHDFATLDDPQRFPREFGWMLPAKVKLTWRSLVCQRLKK